MGILTKKNIVIGIIVLFILSAVASTMNPKTSSNNSTTQAPSAQASEDVRLKIGDTITLKDFKYKVLGVSKSKSVGSEFASKTANGIFLILEIEAENFKKDSEILTYGNFKVKDSKNREFDVDTSATIYTGSGIFVDRLQPGIPKRGQLVFEVPNDETIEFRVRISEGLILKKREEVVLGNLSVIKPTTQTSELSSFGSSQLPSNLCQEFQNQCDNSGECEELNDLKQFGAC